MIAHPFQVMPPLSRDERGALEASIRAHGVLVAVEYDETGQIIDGHHRVAICRKIGILDWPKSVRNGLTDAEKRAVARQLNVARRQLSTAQKQAVIEAQLRDAPDYSNRFVASLLGVDSKTVGARRKNLIVSGILMDQPQRRGADGKMQPAHRRRLLENSPKLLCGTPIANIRWDEISALIRQNELDNAVLKAIQQSGIPSNPNGRIGETMSSVALSQMLRGL